MEGTRGECEPDARGRTGRRCGSACRHACTSSMWGETGENRRFHSVPAGLAPAILRVGVRKCVKERKTRTHTHTLTPIHAHTRPHTPTHLEIAVAGKRVKRAHTLQEVWVLRHHHGPPGPPRAASGAWHHQLRDGSSKARTPCSRPVASSCTRKVPSATVAREIPRHTPSPSGRCVAQ